LGGHDHDKFLQPIIHEGVGTTWVVQSGYFWQNIGRVELNIQDRKLNNVTNTLVPLDASIQEDAATKAMVDQLVVALANEFGTQYTTAKVTEAEAAFSETPLNLFMTGNHDTDVGKLVSDAFRDKTKTDIAIEPCGSTAQPLYKGPITGMDLYRMIGYGYNQSNKLGFRVVTFKITGQELYKGIETCLSQIEYNDDFFPQVSGMEFAYNANAAAGERVIFPSIKIGGQALDLSKNYTVTTNEFVATVMAGLGITITDMSFLPNNETEFQGTFITYPERESVPENIKEQLIVELYSK
jgi:2',3'-cyclic-nucleotide 2'-phosphodiesterase (5'-nucleotidase family)